jgi:hypothetical protein
MIEMHRVNEKRIKRCDTGCAPDQRVVSGVQAANRVKTALTYGNKTLNLGRSGRDLLYL